LPAPGRGEKTEDLGLVASEVVGKIRRQLRRRANGQPAAIPGFELEAEVARMLQEFRGRERLGSRPPSLH
jgi:hypothetical protein